MSAEEKHISPSIPEHESIADNFDTASGPFPYGSKN